MTETSSERWRHVSYSIKRRRHQRHISVSLHRFAAVGCLQLVIIVVCCAVFFVYPVVIISVLEKERKGLQPFKKKHRT